MTGFFVDPDSIDGNSHLLAEQAGLLQEGRLDGDTATMARPPRAHPAVGGEVEKFTNFAADQCRDLVALLGALATKLRAVGEEHVTVDGHVRDELERFLTSGVFVPPGKR
ncbi:hypothetical protein A8924_5702 [Saccharopolyspora erythraea NRRL 2338]|uniref:Uncharacterized protein n=2 Tax=Saccharopolyspora erythraea TaxID=1836 RepID=A4FKI4_SACEN|nr:hypothetical protein [Saccharopolyspora erythraea]PFG98197.1 hypothetical protein A8924_5702 [Saccharopolyspora erythraea NRRL 2338]QRK88297.1 hypothetical protein JQX30_26930 [Saccharopolyspora erythraea]CAM04559.1 hypothetical protein SACE_5320 [Saccharopolyspora erythraea NRRL 2338]